MRMHFLVMLFVRRSGTLIRTLGASDLSLQVSANRLDREASAAIFDAIISKAVRHKVRLGHPFSRTSCFSAEDEMVWVGPTAHYTRKAFRFLRTGSSIWP